jgi:hypothetical protein
LEAHFVPDVHAEQLNDEYKDVQLFGDSVIVLKRDAQADPIDHVIVWQASGFVSKCYTLLYTILDVLVTLSCIHLYKTDERPAVLSRTY